MQIDSYVSERKRKQKKRHGYFVSIIVFLVIYFCFLGAVWFVLRSPLFHVDHIVVQGNYSVPEGDVIAILQSSIINKGDSINAGHSSVKALLGFGNMLVWPAAIPSSSLVLTPKLESVRIARDYITHTVTVTVVERQPFAIWCLMPKTDASGNPEGNEQCFWFDQTGMIFGRTFDTEGGAITVIHDYSQTSLDLDGNILPYGFTPNLISIIQVIVHSGVVVNEIALNDLSLEQIDVTTVNGPTISFSLRFPADNDLPVLQSIMAKPGFDKLQYIDFTVQNRAYYK